MNDDHRGGRSDGSVSYQWTSAGSAVTVVDAEMKRRHEGHEDVFGARSWIFVVFVTSQLSSS
jgi:hypothetical protein